MGLDVLIYTDEALLVFSLPDVWHVAPIIGSILRVRGRRGVKDSWSARSIEHISQVIDISGGRGVVHCFTGGDGDGGDHNYGRDEHGKRSGGSSMPQTRVGRILS